jgi:hypothetical protein
MLMQEIPMAFLEDHGHKLDMNVVLQATEDLGDRPVHRVTIAGNIHVGFGFEWRAFANMMNINIGQLVVFTVMARDRFLVQVYEVGKQYSIPAHAEESIAWTGITWLHE